MKYLSILVVSIFFAEASSEDFHWRGLVNAVRALDTEERAIHRDLEQRQMDIEPSRLELQASERRLRVFRRYTSELIKLSWEPTEVNTNTNRVNLMFQLFQSVQADSAANISEDELLADLMVQSKTLMTSLSFRDMYSLAKELIEMETEVLEHYERDVSAATAETERMKERLLVIKKEKVPAIANALLALRGERIAIASRIEQLSKMRGTQYQVRLEALKEEERGLRAVVDELAPRIESLTAINTRKQSRIMRARSISPPENVLRMAGLE